MIKRGLITIKQLIYGTQESTPREITESTLNSFKFCPNCGYSIMSQDQRFCTNCGFELRGIPMKPLP